MATTKRKTKLAPQPATNETVPNESHPPVGGWDVPPAQAPTPADERKAKLDGLATEIRSGHGRCVEALRGVVTQAAAIGKLLNEAKKLVTHGGWKAWVEDHCRFAMRMAQNYMLIARNHERLVTKFGNDTAGWTLTEFIQMVQKFEHEGQKKPQPTTTKADASTPTPPAPFAMPEAEVEQRERRFREEVCGAGSDRVVNEKVITEFVRERVTALYAAVRRFVVSKDVTKLAAHGLDSTDIGMILVESLRAALTPTGVLLPQAKAEPAIEPGPHRQPTAGEAFLANGNHHPGLTV